MSRMQARSCGSWSTRICSRIFSAALAGPKLSVPSIAKLEKLRKLLPAGNGIRPAGVGPFLFVLTEKMTPRERADLMQTLEMHKPEVDLWQKLEPRAKKLEQALKSARVEAAVAGVSGASEGTRR